MDFNTTELATGAGTPQSLLANSPQETSLVGHRIGARLRPGDCLALHGGLGAGKTTLAQGVVAGAGGGQDVRSPTFLLHAVHRGRITVHHLDLYRLPPGVDLRTLGLDELLEQDAAVVEWADRAASAWFNAVIRIGVMGPSARQLELWLPPHLVAAADDG
ncbi:Uncharacterized protein family UPF0079, ATPase bacteria domain protein [mine drainage metagenome]|uniref:tRNA threonylcarbamoyladenosine biosynthesis protein TsaE n=2 Tax=mine drainage metagenome TaxID=410659 RepID=T0YS39_9ZZZZ